MCEHEHKNCPRCGAGFHCKVGSILLCQCSAVKLNQDERDYLSESYDDCLCAHCMRELKAQYNNERFQSIIRRILGLSIPKKKF